MLAGLRWRQPCCGGLAQIQLSGLEVMISPAGAGVGGLVAFFVSTSGLLLPPPAGSRGDDGDGDGDGGDIIGTGHGRGGMQDANDSDDSDDLDYLLDDPGALFSSFEALHRTTRVFALGWGHLNLPLEDDDLSLLDTSGFAAPCDFRDPSLSARRLFFRLLLPADAATLMAVKLCHSLRRLNAEKTPWFVRGCGIVMPHTPCKEVLTAVPCACASGLPAPPTCGRNHAHGAGASGGNACRRGEASETPIPGFWPTRGGTCSSMQVDTVISTSHLRRRSQ